jgi:hypothetical protein
MNLSGGTEESQGQPQDSRPPDRDLNPRSPEYEAVMQTTRPFIIIIIIIIIIIDYNNYLLI